MPSESQWTKIKRSTLLLFFFVYLGQIAQNLHTFQIKKKTFLHFLLWNIPKKICRFHYRKKIGIFHNKKCKNVLFLFETCANFEQFLFKSPTPTKKGYFSTFLFFCIFKILKHSLCQNLIIQGVKMADIFEKNHEKPNKKKTKKRP